MIEDVIEEQGWTDSIVLDIALRWLSDLDLLDTFVGELRRIAAEENGA